MSFAHRKGYLLKLESSDNVRYVAMKMHHAQKSANDIRKYALASGEGLTENLCIACVGQA